MLSGDLLQKKKPSCLFPAETKKRNTLLRDVKQKLLLNITLIWNINDSEYFQFISIRYHNSDLGKKCVTYTSVTLYTRQKITLN